MRLLILGDSQLAWFAQRPWTFPRGTVNKAIGGAIAPEAVAQLDSVGASAWDVVMLGVGTNDAGTRPVPLEEFLDCIRTVIDRVAPAPVVFVTSPGADHRAPLYDDAHMKRYAAEAAAVVRGAGGVVVDTPRVLAPLGLRGRRPDGIHISRAGHALYLPALRVAVRRAAWRGARAGRDAGPVRP